MMAPTGIPWHVGLRVRAGDGRDGSKLVAQAPVICIVDDDAEVRSSLRSLLRSAGLDVRDYDCAESFLAAPDRLDIACLITDLHMPGLDGLALTRELARAGGSCPVIVMTGFPTAASQAEAERLGAAAFMSKPIDPDALLERVEAALG
jgi:FixJ family two-component response regulator